MTDLRNERNLRQHITCSGGVPRFIGKIKLCLQREGYSEMGRNKS